MKRTLLLLSVLFTGVFTLFSQPIYNEAGIRLYHYPSQEEIEWAQANNVKAVTAPTLPPTGELRPVAEYEPSEAVLIRYPFGIPMSVIKEMAKDIKVITLVANTSQQNTVLSQYNSNGVNTANCSFLIANTNSYWTRDYGPWFMAIDNQEIAMYDFNYNRPRPLDNQINSILAPFLSNDGVQIVRYASNIQHAGGNFMNDGTSQAASTTITLEENSGYTLQQIQQHFLEYMGIEQYHFLTDPLGDYIKHIDCWGKYLAPNKVMIGQVPSSDPRYSLYEAAANYFASLSSPYGTPMQVYRVYTPGASGWYGTATPYTNSLILNKKVFVPQTGNSNDAAAIQAYKNAMPGYEVFGINSSEWEDTDALHCRTHEIADRCMLYVKHQPLFGEIENAGTLTFSTELFSYCQNTIYQDSVIIYLRINGGVFTGFNMEYDGENTWDVAITGLPSGEYEYYIFAADESGRRECHPYIGAPDPHKFTLKGEAPHTPILNIDKISSSVTLDCILVAEDQITISNVGNADLEFDIADIEFPVNFIVAPLKGTVAPDDSQVLTLTYDITSLKNTEYSGSFKLLSNDPLNQEIEISLLANIIVGINDAKTYPLTIYPNPASKVININYPDDYSTNAYIYNVLGTLLHETMLSKGVNAIEIQHFPAGVYFVKINTEVFKLIKY